VLELTWHPRSADIPDAVWKDCFAPPHEGLFWFSALEAAGIRDQFEFWFGLVRDGRAAVGIVPAFVFDLPLDLVLPDGAARIASLLERSPLRKLTRIRTFFIGSVAGEEGHVGLNRGYALRDVGAHIHAEARKQASRGGAALLVWKDFPECDRAALDGLAETNGVFRMPSYPGSSIRLVPGGFEACLMAMPSRHRYKMRKRLRNGAALLPMTSSVIRRPAAAQLEEMFALYEQTYRRGKTKFERLTPEFFARIAGFEEATFVVQRHPESGRMLAFMLLFDLGERVINQFIGIDYEATQGAFAYFRLFAAAYDWACTTRARAMQSGQTGYMAKIESGHTLVPLWNYCEHRNPPVNAILRKMARRITWETLDDQLREWLIAHPQALPPPMPRQYDASSA
jgi:hypothetical protein